MALSTAKSRCLGVRANEAGAFEHCHMRTQCERYLALNTDTADTWRDAWVCRTPQLEQRIEPQPRDWERQALTDRGIKPIKFEVHGDSSAASVRDGADCGASGLTAEGCVLGGCEQSQVGAA